MKNITIEREEMQEYWEYIITYEFMLSALIILLLSYILWYKLTKCARIRLFYTDNPTNNFLIKNSRALSEIYRPSPYLLSGHLQTMCYGIIRHFKRSRFGIIWNRDLVRLEDGGEAALDWAIFVHVEDTFSTDTPILILMPGLTGGNHDIYIADTIYEAAKYGYKAALLNHRGCSNSKLKSPTFYCASSTGDTHSAIRHIRNKYPLNPIYGIGFSLGANILTNYMAEKGSACMLSGAVGFCNPFNFKKLDLILPKTLFGIYHKRLGKHMVALISRHIDDLREIEQYVGMTIEEGCRLVKTSRDFDNIFTSKVLPTKSNPYKTAHNYYVSASCDQKIKDVSIPTLFLNFGDDPVVVKDIIAYKECQTNPHIILGTHPCGGHLGGFGGWIPKSWICKPTISFINSIEMLKIKKYDEVD